MKQKLKLEGESLTYVDLWHASRDLIYVAESGCADRANYLYLSAMVMVFFALEAYLNHLCAIVSPNEWKDERSFFGPGLYQGPLGKLDFVAKRCGVRFDTSRVPYQTLKNLLRLRDFVAHGRTETFSEEVRSAPGCFPEFRSSYLETQVSKSQAKGAYEHTGLVIRQLHEAAIAAKLATEGQLGADPLITSSFFQTVG